MCTCRKDTIEESITISRESYDDFKTQERLFKESEEEYKEEIKELKKGHKLVWTIKSHDYSPDSIEVFTTDEKLNATFKKMAETQVASSEFYNNRIKKIYERGFWLRMFNKEIK